MAEGVTAPHALTWLGRDEPHLDTATVVASDRVVLGCYGGRRDAGATKNEDGALIWCAPDGAWEFAAILDAHATAESAALVLAAIAARVEAIAGLLALPVGEALRAVEREVLDIFTAESFREACRGVQGETACLICVRREQFLWWLSTGDCVAYLLHPELAALGQYALNQRQFFEWVGRVNTFDLAVPCYTSGVRELRGGRSVIVLATDGLLECGTRPLDQPEAMYRAFVPERGERGDLAARVRACLERVHQERGRDSATVIAWEYENPYPAVMPSQ
jgi:serine/threonine protein phosphatase PrpC